MKTWDWASVTALKRNAMSGVERDMEKAIPTSFNVGINSRQLALAGGGGNSYVNHTGIIRLEGVNNQGQFMGAVNVLMDDLTERRTRR